MERLQAAGVAAGRVADAADLCARDPQLAARGHFVDVATARGPHGSHRRPAVRAVRHAGARCADPGRSSASTPTQVLREVLGLEADEIAALRADGVVA